jgi:hypothetical protein
MKSVTVHHFAAEDVAGTIMYNTLARFDGTGEVKCKKLSGVPAVQTSQKHVEISRHIVLVNSVRAAAKNLKMDASPVSRMKLTRFGITART